MKNARKKVRVLKGLARIRRRASRTGLTESFYVLGFSLIVVAVLAFVLPYGVLTLLGKASRPALWVVAGVFAYAAGTCWCVGSAYEIARDILACWKSPWRWVMLAPGIVIAPASSWASQQLINLLTRINPKPLSLSTLLLATICTLLAWWILVILFLFLRYVWLLLRFFLNDLWSSRFRGAWLMVRNHWFFRAISGKPKAVLQEPPQHGWVWELSTFLGRIVGTILLAVVFLWVPLKALDLTDNQVDRLLTTTVAYGDYVTFSEECDNHVRGERVMVVGGGKVSVAVPAKPGGYTFETRSCNQSTDPTQGRYLATSE